MRRFLFYTVWTFISSLFLKSGIEFISDKNIDYIGPIFVTVFLQIGLIFPIVSAYTSNDKK